MADTKLDVTFTEEQKKALIESCGLNEKILNENKNIILDWCSKEEHLKEAVPYLEKTVFVERQLLLSKGSVEICKKRIDHVLTARGLMSELTLNRNPEEFKPILSCMNYVFLPKLHPLDLSRIIIAQFHEDLDNFSFLRCLRYAFYVGEFRLYDDYCISERYIIDMKNLNLGILAKINLMLMKKADTLTTDGYGTKVKGVHILNATSFVDKFVFLLKQGLKQKIADRVHVHSSYEDFYKHIPKEILPKEYGGDEPSCEKLKEAWTDLLNTEESQKKLKDLDYFVSDETRRSSSNFNEEYLGMPGSFRKLDVD